MNCDELREATRAYAEGTLPGGERAAYEAHAAGCGSCGRFIAIARETTCRQVAEFLSEYIECRLPPVQLQVFEHHLGTCPPCLDYLRALRATIEAGRRACEGEAASKVPEALVKAILAARRST